MRDREEVGSNSVPVTEQELLGWRTNPEEHGVGALIALALFVILMGLWLALLHHERRLN